jgi:hypothetical protein
MWWDNQILHIAVQVYKRWGQQRFGQWVKQESLKEKIVKAVESGSDDFPDHLLEFVSTALHVSVRYIQDAEWGKIVEAFYQILLKSPDIKLPLTAPHDSVSKSDDWDYEGRTWHLYSHLLAKHYGWTLEYISQLQVIDALAKIQEILTEEQLEREFTHSLSEIAYVYDKSSKKSTYKPLTRPHWMRPRIKPIRKYMIPKSYMPIGEVDYGALIEEYKPKEIIH